MTYPGPIEDDRPVIGGFCFDETYGFPVEQKNAMAKTGKLYITTFKARDKCGKVASYGGTLIADSFTEAIAEAKRRKLGETVTGVMDSVMRGENG